MQHTKSLPVGRQFFLQKSKKSLKVFCVEKYKLSVPTAVPVPPTAASSFRANPNTT